MDKTKNQKKNEKKRASRAAKRQPREESELINLQLPATLAPRRGQSDEVSDFEASNLKQRVEAANKGWPWASKCPQKLVTQAPFVVNEFNNAKGFFQLPAATQTSPLFRLDVGLIYKILEYVFQYHGPAGKFAATCQKAFGVTGQFVDHWDISRSNFLLCDQEDISESDVGACVGRVVVVSQFRNRQHPPGNHDIELYALQHMTLAINNFSDRFEVLHLHRIPMLTVEVLALIIPELRNLRMLGIYRCELLHLASALPILKILRENRGVGKTTNIAFDFYPRFHVGPENVYDRTVFTGSYGVTWDNFMLDSRLGIWALVVQILSVARAQGVDFTSEDSAFRLWLEKSPCWRVRETLEMVKNGKDIATILSHINFPYYHGKPSLAQELIPTFTCGCCRQLMHRVFFDQDELLAFQWSQSNHSQPSQSYIQQGATAIVVAPAPAPPNMVCLGCKLTRHLDKETDHRKLRKQLLVNKWLTKADGEFNADDIDYALDIEVRMNARKFALREERYRLREEVARRGKEESQQPFRKGIRYSPFIGTEARGFW